MGEKKRKKKIFSLCFGGIRAVPIAKEEREWNPVKARNAMVKMLSSNKKVVQHISIFEVHDESDYVDTVSVCPVGDDTKIASYHWYFPVVFKVKANKGFSFVDSNERKRKLESSIEALVFYNGSWFMSLFDVQQFSKVDELFECGPNVREILLHLMKKVKLFTPEINAPCIIPVSIHTEIITTDGEGRKRKGVTPEYIKSYKKRDSSDLILEYEIKIRNKKG